MNVLIRKAVEADHDEFLALSEQFEEGGTTSGLVANTSEVFHEYLGGSFNVIEA